MTIHLYNTLSRQREVFEPLEAGKVRMYVCGPTVYDDSHIGHLMGPVLFDVIARWLAVRGFAVQFVNNITDIDDKIINRANATGEAWESIAERYTEQYMGLLERLAVETVTDHPRCTEYVPQMLTFVQQLIDADRAYVTSDGVYYDVQKQDGYGKLSGRKVEDMLAGARVEANDELRHAADFALWKAAKPGEPTWDSPWGPGRPGWHLECSVMSSELLGSAFDIHGGGDDLKFPHHENEIAQSEAHGDAYARCWMHNGLVQYGGKKVAKSDPRMKDPEFSRQFQAQWLIDTYGAPTIRFFLLRGHYRRPIDFEPENVVATQRGLLRLLEQLGDTLVERSSPSLEGLLNAEADDVTAQHRAKFVAAMDDDFRSGEAIAELYGIASHAKGLSGDEQRSALCMLRDLGRLIGLFGTGDRAELEATTAGGERLSAVLDAMLDLRQRARGMKKFDVADAYRDAFAAHSVQVSDGAEGTTWSLAVGADEDAVLKGIVEALLAVRKSARDDSDYATSDAIRDALTGAGVELKDGPEGTAWS